MADFNASLVPLVVPSLATATANDIAQFQAQFTTNIVNTGNSLLQAYIALKDTDFWSVGDIPALGDQLNNVDTNLYAVADERPNATYRPAIDFAAISTKLDQLAALLPRPRPRSRP